MEGTGGVEKLDELIRDFAASGYAASGADVDGDSGHGHGHGEGHGASTRRFNHRGHEVEIVTGYEVTIDGSRWNGELVARPDGTVAYHGLPQYAVPSAVDLVRSVIDTSHEAPDSVRDAIRDARERQ